jgi:UDP-glucose 4-epimerase
VPFILGSAGDKELVTSIIRRHRITDIMHFSGSTVVSESVARPLWYYENNTAVARTLLEAAVENGIQNFLFSSTAAVYGDPLRVPVCEDDTLHPVSPYGRSKLMVEWMLRDASTAHVFNHVILRYFNVAGADPFMRTGLSTPGATHVVKVAVETAVGKRPYFELFGTDYDTPDGTCIRDFIPVTDLAEAHVAALFYLQQGGESTTLNCGYGRGYSVREVLETVHVVSGRDFPVRIRERRAGDIAVSVADASKIRRLLPWQPRFDDLRTIVAHALAWERLLPHTAAQPTPALVPEFDSERVPAEEPLRRREVQPS